MNVFPALKKLVVALSVFGACASAGATSTDLGPLTQGATPFSGTVLTPGPFGDTFSFILPSNGGSSYGVVNFPFTFLGSTFNTSFTSITLYKDIDSTPFDDGALEVLVGNTTSAGSSLSLNVGPLVTGNYYLVVQGVANGTGGGLYSGAISVSPVPEPETYGLFLAGLGLLGTIMTRRRKV